MGQSELKKAGSHGFSDNALKYLVLVLVAALFIHMLILAIEKFDYYQWDFKTYYYAGKAHAAGLNPYGLTALSQVAGHVIIFRFRYPPLTIWFCRALALFDYKTAYILFIALKILLLAGIFFIWKRWFLGDQATVWFFVFALLAFNSAIFVDIHAGNISIFEQFGLWLAFVFFLKRKYLFFCLLLFLLSLVKITPLFFLVLLLFVKEKKRLWYFFGTGLASALVFLVSALASPLWEDFRIFGLEIEVNMASFFLLIRDDLKELGKALRLSLPPVVGKAVFLCFAAAVIFVTWRAIVALRSRLAEENEDFGRRMIYLTVFAYALLIPRFPAYSHMILIVPVWYVLKNLLAGTEGVLLFVLACLSTQNLAAMPGLDIPMMLIWKYQTVFIALFVWGLFAFRIFQEKKQLKA